MSDIVQGGCACGAIRYEYSDEPITTYNCHCRVCQQFTGSAYISGIILPANTFKLTAGKPTYYTIPGDSGSDISRGFCAVCGSPVCAMISHMPDAVSIAAASLDDPSQHTPSMDIYTSHAQLWDHMNPDLPKFAEMPPTEEGDE